MERTPLARNKKKVVILGGGFAGVECAGELVDLLLDARKHYHSIHKEDLKVVVLEALPMILPGFDQKLAEFAKEKMVERGIEIRLKTAVTSFEETRLLQNHWIKIQKMNQRLMQLEQ